MKINIILFISFALMHVQALVFGKETVVTLKPILAAEFGVLTTVDGILCRGSDLGYVYKGADDEIFLRVTSLNGARPKNEVRVKVRAFNADIAHDVENRVKLKQKVSLVGYESFAAEGVPHRVAEYIDLPQSVEWYIAQFFVVVNCASSP